MGVGIESGRSSLYDREASGGVAQGDGAGSRGIQRLMKIE